MADRGVALLPGALDDSFRAALLGELSGGPVHRYRERFSAVRQEIEGFDVETPFIGFDLLARLCRELTAAVRQGGGGIAGLATWRVNEAGVVHYRQGSIGITSHLDGKRHRRLVVVATLSGSAGFELRDQREGAVREFFDVEAGSLVLLRGPGLAGVRDGRPFHAVGTPKAGDRWSLGLRMALPLGRC